MDCPAALPPDDTFALLPEEPEFPLSPEEPELDSEDDSEEDGLSTTVPLAAASCRLRSSSSLLFRS